MERRNFIRLLGGSASLFALYCMGCQKDTSGPSNVDFTIDLTDPNYSKLKQNGNFIIKDGVILAKTIAGDYVAVSAQCTHEGVQLDYDSSGNKFHCSAHGSNFSTSGKVQNGPATSDLKTYTVTVTGNSIRVKS